MGFLIVYKKLIFKGIKFAFRITRIMLILGNLNFVDNFLFFNSNLLNMLHYISS